ncbi:unnamed protein product [Rotaria socialis]
MAVNMNTTIKSTTATTSETTTTTTTSITTTTSETTTTTAGVVVTSTLNYAVELTGNGYHGVTKVRYYSVTNMGSSMRYGHPIAYLSGTTFSGNYVNNVWYDLHVGYENVNGVASCTAVYKSLSKSYAGITASYGTGYIGSFTTYTSPDCAVYILLVIGHRHNGLLTATQ